MNCFTLTRTRTCLVAYTFLKKIYLFIHERHTHTQRQRSRQREKQSLCGEPDVGLNPSTPGSLPEPKTDAQPLSHPGAPKHLTLDFGSGHDLRVVRLTLHQAPC